MTMQSIFIPIRKYLVWLIFLIISLSPQLFGKEWSLQPSKDALSKILSTNIDSDSLFALPATDTKAKGFIDSNTYPKQINLRFNLGKKYFDQSKYSEAQHIFQEIVAYGNLENDWEIIAGCHNYLSLIATFNEDYMEVYYHNKKLFEFGNKYSPLWLAIMNLNLGTFYMSMNDLTLAEEMYNRGIAIFKKIPKQNEYGWLLHRLGELQIESGKLSQAKISLSNALTYWEKTNNYRGKSFTLQQLGLLAIASKQSVSAKKYFLSGLDVAKKHDIWMSQISILIRLGELAGKEKKYPEAIQYLEESADLSIKKNIPYFFKDSYYLLAENYEAMGKIQAANKNYQDYLIELEKTVKINQSTTKEWAKSFDNLNAKEQAYNLLKETESINQETLKLQRTIIVAAFLIIALSLFIAYSYFKASQVNAKQNDELELLNQKIQEQANQLSIANKNITTQKNELQIELVKKLLVLSNHSESVKAIEHTLGQMDITKETLEIKKLITNTKDDSLWKELDIQLSQSNTDFFEKLSKKHSNLTKGDLRLCAFLKMNLSTKEIANLTFKNPESVKVARSRLRKKLGLTHSNIVLSSFLNQI